MPDNSTTKPDWDEGNTQMWVGPENQPTTNSTTRWDDGVPASIIVNYATYTRRCRADSYGTGSHPQWPYAITINGWVYWRSDL